MKVGLTMDMRNVKGEPWRKYWEDYLWLICEAESMGFDYVGIQEHFFTEDGYGPSIPIFIAMLAERTRTIRLGSYVYVLPLHHAAQLAQETAVLDHITGGRLDVGVGAGHRPLEYHTLGMSPKSRPSRMDEGLDVLKLAWAGEPFGYHGTYYDFDEIHVQPTPLQKPHPPLWVAATAPSAAARAGRHGANLAGASVDPEVFNAYLGGLAEAGIAREDVRISAAWSIVVTNEDPEVKWGRHQDLYFERWDFFRRIRSEMGDADLLLNDTVPPAGTYRENDLVGSPDFITGVLKDFATKLPITDIVYASPTAGIPIREEAYQDMKLFADTVMPEIKSW